MAQMVLYAVVSAAVSYAISEATKPDIPNTYGPRLEDKRIQTSTYGSSIPIVYGTYRIAGTVVWATELEESPVVTSGGGGGKGGSNSGTSTQYVYYANFGIVLCEGEITGIRRVWADGRLIHNSAYAGMSLPFARVYAGSETQMPDPFIESVQGVGKTPAYRGNAYVVFEKFLLSDYGNRVPQLTFEVERSVAPTVSAQGAPSTPMSGSLTLAESSTVPWVGSTASISPTEGSGTYITNSAGQSIAVAQTSSVGGEYGFETALHTPAPTWSAGGRFKYSTHGGANAPAKIWAGQTLGRRVVYEQVIAGNGSTDTKLISVWLGAAATTAVVSSPESYTIPPAFTTAPTNFSRTAATASERHKVIVNPITHRTYLCAFTAGINGALNRGGVIANGTPNGVDYVYDFRPLATTGHALLDVTFDGAAFYTAELPPAGANSALLKRFNALTFTVEQAQPLPTGSHASSDWRIHRRGGLTYVVAMPSGRIYLELSGRWCYLGSLQAADVSSVHFGQGRDYFWTVMRPGWVLSRYALAPPASFTLLPGLGGGYPLAGIVTDLCKKTSLQPSDIDTTQLPNMVRGFVITRPMTARAALESLLKPHFVAGVESDAKVKWYPLKQPVLMTIPDEDLDVRVGGEAAKQLMTLTRTQEVDIPYRITLVYAALNGPDYSYQEGEVHAQRLNTKSVNEFKNDLPISLKLHEAQTIGDAFLQAVWTNRVMAKFTTQRGTRHNNYSILEPGDVVTARGYTLRIIEKLEDKGVIEWTAVVDDPAIYPFVSALTGIEIEVTDAPDEVGDPDADDTSPPDDNGDGDMDDNDDMVISWQRQRK